MSHILANFCYFTEDQVVSQPQSYGFSFMISGIPGFLDNDEDIRSFTSNGGKVRQLVSNQKLKEKIGLHIFFIYNMTY